jgi:spermidine synthase
MTQRQCGAIFAFFLLGAYSTAVQVLLIREFLVIFFGNELCLGIIFSAWFAAIFLGSRLGARVVARAADPLLPFVLLLGILAYVPALQIILIRTLRLVLHLTPGELVSFVTMLASALLLVFPFSALVGFIFPFASALSLSASATPIHAAPKVYIFEASGSALSGAALAFFLLPRFSAFQLIALFSLLISLNCFFLGCPQPGTRTRRALVLFPTLLLALWGATTTLDLWTSLEQHTTTARWHTINPRMTFLDSTNSRYQNLAAASLQGQYSIYGNGQILVCFPDPFQVAQQAHFLLTQHPHPTRVLLIGGGLSGIITEILTHPVAALDYVELDPLLLSFAMTYLSPPDRAALHDPRVRLIPADGRAYVRTCREHYDLVIALLPDPATAMLNRFYTVDFFAAVARTLASHGLFITSLTAAADYVGQDTGRYTGSVYHSLLQVFPHVLIAPGERTYFFASRTPGVASTDPEILARRFLDRGIVASSFSPSHYSVLLLPERRTFLTNALKRGPLPRLNTDSRPIAYFYNFILWDLFSGGQARQFFRRIEHLPWPGYLLLFGCVVLLRIFYCVFGRVSRRHQMRSNALLAIVVAGYSAMGLEIIFLFTYQNTFGCLYQKVGLLIALFMTGLALGAALLDRALFRFRSNWTLVLLSLQVLIAAFSALLPSALGFVCSTRALGPLSSETFFFSFVFLAGLLTGAAFPLVHCALMATGLPLGRAAGLANAYDHLGACLGAAVTGTVLVPLLGTVNSAFLIAGINLVPILLLGFFLLGPDTAIPCPPT